MTMRMAISIAVLGLGGCGAGGMPGSSSTVLETNGVPVPVWEGLEDGRMRVAIIGDFGTADANAIAVADQVATWGVDQVWTTGDNTYSTPSPEGYATDVDGVWGAYITSGGVAGGNRFWPCPGNHDWSFSDGLSAYVEHFDLPGNERYYSIRLGDVELFCLSTDPAEPDGVVPRSVQAEWLEEALAQSTAPWKWVTTHHPPHSSGMHGDTSGLDWPFTRWGASGVWSGHDHHYERTIKNGAVFGVTGIGGVSLRTVSDGPQGSVAAVAGHHGATLMQVDSQTSTFTTIDVAGLILDQFTVANNQPATPDHVLLPFHQEWHVRSWGLEDDWLEAGFEDQAWPVMVAPVGSGDAPISRSMQGSGPRASGPLRMRTVIDVADAASWGETRLQVRATAGVVVWINGTEVYRERVPEGPISPDSIATAQGTDQGWIEVDLGRLVEGPNAVAVAVVPHDGWSLESWADVAIVARPANPLVPKEANWEASVDVHLDPWPGSDPFASGTWVPGAAPWGWSDYAVKSELPASPTAQTAWFAHRFEVDGAVEIPGLILEALRADGAVLYLNGQEIHRQGIPITGISAGASTPFTPEEAWRMRYASTWVDPNLLVDGENVLAAQVYAAFPGRPLVFDAALYPVQVDGD